VLFEQVFDTGRVTAIADPPPWRDPDPDPDDGAGDPRPAETSRDDGLLDDQLPDDAGPGYEADPDAGWAVPGLGADHDGAGGLSRTSREALDEAAAAWTALRRAQARCYRALTGLDLSDAAAETGYRTMSRLLTDHLRLDPREATRLRGHARSLAPGVSSTGSTVPSDLPATAAVVEDGVIGSGHVDVIRRTMRRLAAVPGLDAETLATTEAQLAELAMTHSPAALAEAATAILALLDPDGTAPDDDPLPENELHYLRRRDGSLVGKFAYRDPAAAETLHTALTSATPPDEAAALADRSGPDQDPGVRSRGEKPGDHALRTLPARRAQAMLDLAAEAVTRGLDVDDPTGDGAPGSAGVRPAPDEAPPPPSPTRAEIEGGERVALTVTLNYETLRAALIDATPPDGTPRLALLGENTWVRPETARRLACDADLVPAVLGSASEVLDLGRKARIATLALRRAVVLRDRHCAHPGCRRRARRCQVHHIEHWIDGGETCLENCVLLCAYHHTLIHHGGWEIHVIGGLPYFLPPPWLDPDRRPRHNRPWQTQGR
jgi:Domain of unknown function (DUF222)